MQYGATWNSGLSPFFGKWCDPNDLCLIACGDKSKGQRVLLYWATWCCFSAIWTKVMGNLMPQTGTQARTSEIAQWCPSLLRSLAAHNNFAKVRDLKWTKIWKHKLQAAPEISSRFQKRPQPTCTLLSSGPCLLKTSEYDCLFSFYFPSNLCCQASTMPVRLRNRLAYKIGFDSGWPSWLHLMMLSMILFMILTASWRHF